MSTHPQNRSRPRRAHDPSPSPTLVGSHSSSASTVSLPRHNTAGPSHPYAPGQYNPAQGYGSGPGYGSRYGPGPGYYEPDPDTKQKLEDSVAKLGIFVGIVTVFAGVMHLRKSKKIRQSRQEEHEQSQRRDKRRREREHGARERGNRDWEDWRDHSARQRIGNGEGGSTRRIEYPANRGDRSSRHESNRGGSSRSH